MRRVDLPTLRGALWATRALIQVRRNLRRHGVEGAAVTVRPPQRSSDRGVAALLRRMPSTCLERALVLQRWQAERGSAPDVVIGVKGPGQNFEAHAWLDGITDPEAATYEELMRLPAPQP